MKNIEKINILKWRLASQKEIFDNLDRIRNKTRKTEISLASFARKISPHDLYCYLKIRFGNPNGFCMKLKQPGTTDNLIHWHYELIGEASYIHIYGKKNYTEFVLSCDKSISEEMWLEMIRDIKIDLGNMGDKKTNLIKDFEKWELFTNPYKLIKSRIKKLEEEIKCINDEIVNLKQNVSDLNVLSNTISLLAEKFFILNMLLPIMAETFLNAIIFITCKPELKNDNEKFENIKRADIHKRIEELHLNCMFFNNPIHLDALPIKNFRRIMSTRNDLLHGNFLPSQTSYNTVYFDETIPNVKESYSPIESLFIKHMKNIGSENILQKLEQVKEFEKFILSFIEEKVRQNILIVLDNTELGWDAKRKKIGVLFPETNVAATFQPTGFCDWCNDLSKIYKQ